jgi:hypothetical protein
VGKPKKELDSRMKRLTLVFSRPTRKLLMVIPHKAELL